MKKDILALNFLILTGICSLIWVFNKIHDNFFLKINKFDFLTLNFIYLLYIFFFFSLGFLVPNLHSKLFFEKKPKQIEERIFISEKKLFQIDDFVKFDSKKKYICFLLKEYNQNFLEKNARIRFCTHSLRLFNEEIWKKNFILEIDNFEIKPIPGPVFPYDFNLKRFYFFKNIIGIIYSNNLKILEIQNQKLSLISKINHFRHKNSLKLVQTFGQESGGLIAALVFGTRIFVSKEINDDMKKSSMLHLIAISGLHISFISLLFFRFIFMIFLLINHFFFCRLRYFVLKKIALLISLLAAFSYLVISGFSVSAQRAFIMFFLYIFHNFFCKQIVFTKIIFISIISFILLNPVEILNPGLQMSFLSIIGLFVFSNRQTYRSIKLLTSKMNCANWIRDLSSFILRIISGSIGPHLLTMPISAFYFLQITTYTFLANIAAIPLMSFVIAPLIIIYFLLKILNFESFDFIIQNFLNFSFGILKKISFFFANHAPFNSFYIDQISKTSFLLFFLGICMIFVWKNKNSLIFSSFFIFFALIFGKFEKTTPEILVLKEKNSINYFFFDEFKSNIYFFSEKIDKNKIVHTKINYFLEQRFGKKYNFIKINESDAKKLLHQKNKNHLGKFQEINLE